MYADGLQRTEEDLNALKRSLVAAGVNLGDLFSAEAEAWSGDPVEDDDVDFDYSGVTWATEMPPDEWELMKAALVDNQVTVRGDGFAPAAAPITAVPWETDREWT